MHSIRRIDREKRRKKTRKPWHNLILIPNEHRLSNELYHLMIKFDSELNKRVAARVLSQFLCSPIHRWLQYIRRSSMWIEKRNESSNYHCYRYRYRKETRHWHIFSFLNSKGSESERKSQMKQIISRAVCVRIFNLMSTD